MAKSKVLDLETLVERPTISIDRKSYEILSPDARMGAPPYWQRLEGHEVVHHLLGIIIHTIEGFTYHREWIRDAELALEFRGTVSGLELQGIDLITIGADGRLVGIDVMIRPVNALQELIKRVAPQMADFFATRASGD